MRASACPISFHNKDFVDPTVRLIGRRKLPKQEIVNLSRSASGVLITRSQPVNHHNDEDAGADNGQQ